MAKRIKEQVTGGGIDESLSERSLSKIASISPDSDLACQIGELLGSYRLWKAVRDTAPTPGETSRHLKKTRKLISELLLHLDLMPEEFKALASVDTFKAKNQGYGQFSRELKRRLQLLDLLCNRMEAKFPVGKGGARSKHLEHGLLSDVAQLIEPKVRGSIQAAGLAAEILRNSGVHNMPDNPQKARTEILKYRKLAGVPQKS